MSDSMTSAAIPWESVQWSSATSLALPIDSPRDVTDAFGLAPLTLTPARSGSWVGSRTHGASINAYDAHLSVHSAGTHTECAAHVSDLPLRIDHVAPLTLPFARLLHVSPTHVGNDDIVTRSALQEAWERFPPQFAQPPHVQALIVRSRPTDASPHKRWSGTHPPFFEPEAMRFLVQRGVEHLVTDLPSVDPEDDGGDLAAHRIFFALEGGGDARTERATITELAWIPPTLEPGYGVLRLDVLAWPTDASPSRPIFYPLLPLG